MGTKTISAMNRRKVERLENDERYRLVGASILQEDGEGGIGREHKSIRVVVANLGSLEDLQPKRSWHKPSRFWLGISECGHWVYPFCLVVAPTWEEAFEEFEDEFGEANDESAEADEDSEIGKDGEREYFGHWTGNGHYICENTAAGMQLNGIATERIRLHYKRRAGR